MGTRRSTGNPVLQPLFRAVRANHPKADLALLERAYTMAEQMHGTQMRKSGDLYITHLLAVTTILADIGMTESTLVASLLHDTVEDTPYTLDQARTDFGDEVALLVEGVTRLDKVKYGDSAQAEIIRKMIVALSRDIRVLVIKLADRLHTMRTLRYVRAEIQEWVARETLDIYAPLAHRLGMNTIKWELEDLAFATLHPEIYDEIVRLVAEQAPSRNQFLAQVITQVETDLGEGKVKATVTGRLKPYYSIYQKMITGGRDFSDIYDLVGIRILVAEDRDCYSVLGILHSRWNPVLGRFKDYVAMPKFNMYQSLHTTVMGPQSKPVEMQIRTYAHHRRAEYGVAAHWKSDESLATRKSGPRVKGSDNTWIRRLLDWQSEGEDPGEFLESLRFEINRSETYVFTPRGDVIALPSGSTSVDFAYAVHTQVGDKAVAALVNGQFAALDSSLANGDVIQIFTTASETAGPRRDWATSAKTRRARRGVRLWFRHLGDEDAKVHGTRALTDCLGADYEHEEVNAAIGAVARNLGGRDGAQMLVMVGNMRLDTTLVSGLLARQLEAARPQGHVRTPSVEAPRVRRRLLKEEDLQGVLVRDFPMIPVRFAKCCTPTTADQIKAVVRFDGVASIHATRCRRLGEHPADRVVDATWLQCDVPVSGWAGGHWQELLILGAVDRSKLLQAIEEWSGELISVSDQRWLTNDPAPGALVRLRPTDAAETRDLIGRIYAAKSDVRVHVVGLDYASGSAKQHRRNGGSELSARVTGPTVI